MFNQVTRLNLTHEQVRRKYNDTIGARRHGAVQREGERVVETVNRLYSNDLEDNTTEVNSTFKILSN